MAFFSSLPRFFRFLCTGCISTSCDFAAYRLSLALTCHISLSRALGLTVGVIIAYFLNTIWAFKYKKNSLASVVRFILVYAFSIIVNIKVNYITLVAMGMSELNIMLAFLVATAASVVINYAGMKYLVYR